MAARRLLRFRIPERGSREVDRELERLERRGYRIFRDVSVGRRVVEVLAVGPTGVFVIGGQVGGRGEGEVSGQAAEVSAELFRHGLPLWVDGVVVSPNGDLVGSPLPMKGVTVTHASWLADHVLGQPARLGRRQIDRAVAVIVTGHTGLSVRSITYD